jgi:tetratricopeptide (TPR) repeat protein
VKVKIFFLLGVILFMLIGWWSYHRLFIGDGFEIRERGSSEKTPLGKRLFSKRDLLAAKNLKESDQEVQGNNVGLTIQNKLKTVGKGRDNKNSADSNGKKASIVDFKNDLTSLGQNKESPFYKIAVEGVKLMSEGRFEQGLEKLNEALQKDPNNEIALEGLGLYYLEEGKNLEKAQSFFQRLVVSNPNNAVAVNEMAYAIEEASGLEKVESVLKDLAEKHPNSATISSALAHTLTREGRIEEAIPQLESAVSSSLGAGDKENARITAEKAIALGKATGNDTSSTEELLTK